MAKYQLDTYLDQLFEEASDHDKKNWKQGSVDGLNDYKYYGHSSLKECMDFDNECEDSGFVLDESAYGFLKILVDSVEMQQKYPLITEKYIKNEKILLEADDYVTAAENEIILEQFAGVTIHDKFINSLDSF